MSPFINSATEEELPRPETHTGRLSAASIYSSNKLSTASERRPSSSISAYAESPESRLYSSPPPKYENFTELNENQPSLELNIRETRSGGLFVPIELSEETAFMHSQEEEYAQDESGGELLELLRERRIERPELGKIDEESIEYNDELSVEGVAIDIEAPKRPKSEIRRNKDAVIVGDNTFKETEEEMDFSKRLVEESNLSLENIKTSRPLSSYGRELDKKILSKDIKKPPQLPTGNFKKQTNEKISLNEWIVKSRSGKSTNSEIRSKSEMQIFESNNTITENGNKSFDSREENEEHEVTHKELVESIITTVDDILPIFRCIQERIELESILNDEKLTGVDKLEKLKNIFISRNIRFNYAEEYEAQLLGQQYYYNIKERYENLLKQSPDLIANTLLENEFVYLTFDTPEIRKYLTESFLNKNKFAIIEEPYEKPNPRENCYELLVCGFEEVDKDHYFTLSSAGLTEFTDNSESSQVFSLVQFENERKIFREICEIKFFYNFKMYKTIFEWKSEISKAHRNRAYEEIKRISLLANTVFLKPLQDCQRLLVDIYEYRIFDNPLFCYISEKLYLDEEYKGSQMYYKELYNNTYKIESLPDFINEWKYKIPDLNEKLTINVREMSEILLLVCRQVEENIESRLLLEKQQDSNSETILQSISNATTFNVSRVKEMIKSVDYELVELYLNKLLDINEWIKSLLLGVRNLEMDRMEAKDEDFNDSYESLTSEDLYLIEQFKKHTMDENEFEKEEIEKPLTDYEELLEFLNSFDKLSDIASESLKEIPEITQQIKFDRFKRETYEEVSSNSAKIEISRDILPSQIYEYFEYALPSEIMDHINAYAHSFENVPLAMFKNNYPPAPIFYVKICLKNKAFNSIPCLEDFLELIGDCLSETATVFHRSLRPFSYPKLASVVSETRTTSLSEFEGLNLKEMLAESEDYIEGVRDIKGGLNWHFELISEYTDGFENLFGKFESILESFNYSEFDYTIKWDENDIIGLKCPLETAELLVYNFTNDRAKICEFLLEVAFPALEYYDEYEVEEPINENEPKYNKNDVFGIPSWNEEFLGIFEEHNKTYALNTTLVEPEHFIKRVQELNEFFIDLELLKTKRSILSFTVSTTELYDEFAPVCILFYFIIRNSLPLSIKTMEELLLERLMEHSIVLENVPPIPEEEDKDFKVPKYYEINNCIFDMSEIIHYEKEPTEELDIESITREFEEKLSALRREVNEKRQKAEMQRKLFLETQELVMEKVHNKRNKKEEESETEECEEQEESTEPSESVDSDKSPIDPTEEQIDNFVAKTKQLKQQFYETNKIEELSESGQLLLQYLNKEIVDVDLLDRIKNTIEVYEIAKSEIYIFKEANNKLTQLFESGTDLEILDDSGNIKFDDLSLYIFSDVFRVNFENDFSLKDEFKEFENVLYILERDITNFTIKKPELYKHFKQNLLEMYIELTCEVQELLTDALKTGLNFNIYLDELEQNVHRNVIYKEEEYFFEKGESITNTEELFLYLLFENTDLSQNNDFVKFTLLSYEELIENLEEINREYHYFEKCIELFDSLDFNIAEGVNKTELSCLIEFCNALLSTYEEYWLNVEKLQALIKNECCQPIALLGIDNIEASITSIAEEFNDICQELSELSNKFSLVIEKLQYDQNDVLLNSSIPDDYEDCVNFVTLKEMVFIYKSYLKKTQLFYSQNISFVLKKELEEIIEYEEREENNEELKFEFSLDNDPDIFKSINVDQVQFSIVAKDLLTFYFDVELHDLRLCEQLTGCMKDLSKLLRIMQTVAFQPRHFEYICRYFVPTPDLSYEVWLLDRLLLKPTKEQSTMSLVEFFAEEKDNAYRRIFGPEGDGILELLLYHVAIIPRKETYQKELIGFKFYENSAFTWDLDKTYIDTISKLPGYCCSKARNEYLQEIKEEDDLALEMKIDKAESKLVKQFDTDIEDEGDAEVIASKAELFETTISTVELHNGAILERLSEVLFRRRKAKHESSKQLHKQLQKGGVFVEMDRFSCSISRLVFRGLLDKYEDVLTIAKNSHAEYELLDKLGNMEELIKTLKFKMLSYYIDELEITYISDASHVIQSLNDQLINLISLRSQFGNLINTDVSVAMNELNLLKSMAEQTIKTIKEIMITQTSAMNLMPVFSNPETALCKALPEETRTFNRSFKSLCMHMQAIFEQEGYAVQNCTQELLKQLQEKLQPDFDSISKSVENYLRGKRENCARFFFISDKLLCAFLSLQFEEQNETESITTLNETLDQVFFNIKQTDGSIENDTDGEKRFIIKQLLSGEGESLSTPEFALRGQSETWISNIEQRCTNTLNAEIAACFQEFLYFSRESMSIYGFDNVKRTAKEQKAWNEQFEKKLMAIVDTYCLQTLTVCFQSVVLYYFDHNSGFYNMEVFNLEKKANYNKTLSEDAQPNNSQSTELTIKSNLLILYQKVSFGILKAMKKSKARHQELKLQELLLVVLEVCEQLNSIVLCYAGEYENFLTYYFNEQSNELFCVDFVEHQEYIATQPGSEGSINFGYPQGQLYGFEYCGLVSRIILTPELEKQNLFIHHHMLGTHQPLVLSGRSGIGKTVELSDYAVYTGQYLTQIQCSSSSSFNEFEQLLIGTCLCGSEIILEDVNLLATEVFSVLCMYMHEIQQCLMKFQMQFQIGESLHQIMPTTTIFCTISEKIEPRISEHFKVLTAQIPDYNIITRKFLYINGFASYMQLAEKIESFFQLLVCQYIPNSSHFSSFRLFKEYLVMLQATYKRWIARLSKSSKLGNCLSSNEHGYKEQKDSVAFFSFVELYCVVYCVYKFVVPRFKHELELQMLEFLIKKQFGDSIVEMIKHEDESTKALYSSSIQSNLMKTSRASMMRHSGFDVEDVHKSDKKLLFLELVLINNLFTADVDTLMCENVFFGEASLFLEEIASEVVQHDGENDFLTLKDSATQRQAKQSTQQDNRQSISDNDSMSGSGFETKNNGETLTNDEVLNEQAQSQINQFLISAQEHQINLFIGDLEQSGKLIYQNQINEFEEFESALWFRTSIILRGRQNSGRSALWRTILNETNDYIEINPKSLTEKELFGELRDCYFSDGIITSFIRRVLSQPIELDNPKQISTLNLKFVVFNGYSDNLLRLLSAIDDTRCISLPNGELLRIPNNIRFLIELDSAEQVPDKFSQRCITVAINADFFVGHARSWIKSVFSDSYDQYLRRYDIDLDAKELVAKFEEEDSKRYKKKTQQDLIDEKLKGVLKYENDFLEAANLFSLLFSQVLDILEGNDIDKIQFLKQVEQWHELYMKLVVPSQNGVYNTLMEKQVMFFSFYHAIEIVSSEADKVFKELYPVIFKPIMDVLVIPEQIVNMSSMFIDFHKLLPFKVQEDVLFETTDKEEWAELLHSTCFNSNSECCLSALYYDNFQSKFVAEFSEQRRAFAELLLCYHYLQARRMQVICGEDANYYNDVLFGARRQASQKVKYNLTAQSTLEDFKAFISALFNKSEGSMIPQQEVPIIIHLYNLDLADEKILDFLERLLKYGSQFQYDNFQYNLYNYVDFRIVASCAQYGLFYGFSNTVIQRIPALSGREEEAFITQLVQFWSQAKFEDSDQQIFPVFEYIQEFIVEVHTSLRHYSDYTFGMMHQLLNQLGLIDQLTFTDRPEQYYDPQFFVVFKRQLYQSVVFLLTQCVFSNIKISASQEESLLGDAVNKTQLSSQVVELRKQAGLRLQLKYHPSELTNPSNFTLLFRMLPCEDGQQRFTAQCPLHGAQFIETDFPPEYQKLYCINQEVPQNLQRPQNVCYHQQLLSMVETPMFEIRQRAMNFNYAICSSRHVIAIDRPGYQTKYIFLKLAMKYNHKYYCIDEKELDNRPLHDQFIASLQEILVEMLQSQDHGNKFGYFLYVGDSYLHDKRIVSDLNQLFSCQVLYQLYHLESTHLHTIIQLLREQYDVKGALSMFQLEQLSFDIIRQRIVFILAPEIDTSGNLQQLEQYCYFERLITWSLRSVSQAALSNLPEQFGEMRNLCESEQVLGIFLRTFQQIVNIVSYNEQLHDVLFSPNLFQRFLCLYHSVYFTKRAELTRQKAMLVKGVSLFKQSEESISKITADERVLQPKLEKLQADTDALIFTLKDQKQQIEQESKEVKIEEKSLKIKFQQVEQELASAQLELDEVMPILDKAAEALKEISRQEIAEINSFSNPKPQIIMVMSAICVILGMQPGWQESRQLLSSGNLINQLLNVRPLEVSQKSMKQFRQILANEEFNILNLRQISVAASLLANWCLSVIAYCDAYEHVAPRLERLQKTKQEYNENLSQLQEKKTQIQELTLTAQQVEKELAETQLQRQHLEAEMNTLKKRQHIVEKLNDLLNIQHQQWEHELKVADEELEQLSVLSLLAATYALIQFRDQKYLNYESVITEFITSQLGFKIPEPIEPKMVYDFVANQNIEAVWKVNQFFGDHKIFTGMVGLSNLISTPYVIDPDLVFTNACQQLKLQFISPQSGDWIAQVIKSAASAKTVILQFSDVLNMPNIVKQIIKLTNFDLNRLFTDQSKYDNTQETVIGDTRLTINDHFQLVIINSDIRSELELPPEVLSYYQVISFIKDKESLNEQLENVIIDSLNANLENQRIASIQNEAKQEIQLSMIENQIVQVLLLFDFESDLDQSDSTIIPELQRAIECKEQLQQSLLQIAQQTDELVKVRKEWTETAWLLSYMYISIQRFQADYNLAQFVYFVRTFIGYGFQAVADNILQSIPQQLRGFVAFNVMCLLDEERFFDPILLAALQHVILSDSQICIYNSEAKSFSGASLSFKTFSDTEPQLTEFLKGRNEQAFNVYDRCCGIAYLLKGLLKTTQRGPKQQHVQQNSPFFEHFLSRIEDADGFDDEYYDLCPELQYEICYSVQTKWSSHYLQLFNQENNNYVRLVELGSVLVPQYYATIYHICEEIVSGVKQFGNADTSALVLYLSMAFTKILKPAYYETLMRQVTRLPFKTEAQSPDMAIQYYCTHNIPLFVCGPQCLSISLITKQLEQFQPVYSEGKIKPESPKIVITSLEICSHTALQQQLQNQLEPIWLILMNFELSMDEDVEKLSEILKGVARQQNSRVFVLGSGLPNELLKSSTKVLVFELPGVCLPDQLGFEQCKQELAARGESMACETVANEFLGFLLSARFRNIQLKLNYLDYVYFAQLEPNIESMINTEQPLNAQIISEYLTEAFCSGISALQRRSVNSMCLKLLDRKIEREEPQQIFLPEARYEDIYLVGGRQFEYKVQRQAIIERKSQFIEMPLNQFLLLEKIPLEQRLDIREVDNVPLFLSMLRLEAATLYGYSPSDYEIVFSTSVEQYNDLLITNLRPVNILSPKAVELKVLAVLRYKRRDVYLPLFCAPKLQQKEKKSLKIKISMRTSEFSLGSQSDEEQKEERREERPLFERRICNFLMNSPQICRNPIEMRRGEKVIGEVCVDFADPDEIALSGAYLEV